MESYDDDLSRFAAEGALPLPDTDEPSIIEHDGAQIWYAAYGSGFPVILLHGGMGHSGNWGYQVPALVAHGYRPIVIDSRGHGRSTRDDRPFPHPHRHLCSQIQPDLYYPNKINAIIDGLEKTLQSENLLV